MLAALMFQHAANKAGTLVRRSRIELDYRADVTRFVGIVGTSPGIGKSTLCRELAMAWTRAGLRVECFAEEDITSRSEYARVWSDFTRSGLVSPDVLLDATAAYVRSVGRQGYDVVVADALVPFIPSLLAFGHSETEIATFLDSLLGILAPFDPTLIYLDGDPNRALSRAVDREGQGWLEWFVAKLARYRVAPRVHDADSAARYLAYERAVSLRLLPAAGWRVEVISDAVDLSPQELMDAVQSRLGQ